MTNIKTRAISFNLYYGGRSVSEMMSDNKDLDTASLVSESRWMVVVFISNRYERRLVRACVEIRRPQPTPPNQIGTIGFPINTPEEPKVCIAEFF